ncbi:hypothetical protein H4R19_007106 [Coemansia spiralis]|nr:hypothetical protein H4R19_007106 [Coemansia spiralis]
MKVTSLFPLAAGLAVAVHAAPSSMPPATNAVAVRASPVRASPIASAAAAQATHAPSAPVSTKDENVVLLAQLLAPLQVVTLRLLHGLQGRLAGASASNLADALRGPVGLLKEYLISVWPQSPAVV